MIGNHSKYRYGTASGNTVILGYPNSYNVKFGIETFCQYDHKNLIDNYTGCVLCDQKILINT